MKLSIRKLKSIIREAVDDKYDGNVIYSMGYLDDDDKSYEHKIDIKSVQNKLRQLGFKETLKNDQIGLFYTLNKNPLKLSVYVNADDDSEFISDSEIIDSIVELGLEFDLQSTKDFNDFTQTRFTFV